MRAGCGHYHNEAAWKSRLPGALAFLLDVREEPNAVLISQVPPVVQGSPTGTLSVASVRQHAYHLESASDLVGSWQASTTSAVEQLPWGVFDLTHTVPSGTSLFVRAVAEPRP
jgi:hypothetical protein